MNEVLIFAIGTFVTAMSLGAVALLEWAALTEDDAGRPKREPATPPIHRFTDQETKNTRNNRRAG